MARIERTIEVNAPLRAVYNQWTQFEEFPRFMEGVRQVTQLDDAHLHWCANRNGKEFEWDSEITDQVPDQHIAWRDTSGPGNSGTLKFYPVQADKTKVQLTMECTPAVAPSEAADAELLIAQRVEQDLARFKKLLEAQGGETGAWRGEIHYSHAVQSPEASTNDAVSQNFAGKSFGETVNETLQRDKSAQADEKSSETGEKSFQSAQSVPGTAQKTTPYQAAHGSSTETGAESGMGGGQQTKGDADPRGGSSGQSGRVNIEQGEGEQEEARATEAGSQRTSGAARSGGPQTWLPNLLQGWDERASMMRRMTEELDQLFDRFIGRPMSARLGQGGLAGKWMPPVEISQRGDQLIICADLPGIKKEDVQIEIIHDKLTIEGERREEGQEQTAPQGYRRSERSYGHFYRMIPLPEGVDPDSAQASMRDGVLEIRMPVPAVTGQRGRRIEIQPPH